MTIRKGSISIGRVTSNQGDPYIQIDVQDETSRVGFLRLEMSMVAFAQAITGLSVQPMSFDLRGVEFVGMHREHKTELVPRPPYATHNDRARIAADCLRSFEVDGWEGRADDLWNSHKAAGDMQRVHFERYVKAEPDA